MKMKKTQGNIGKMKNNEHADYDQSKKKRLTICFINM